MNELAILDSEKDSSLENNMMKDANELVDLEYPEYLEFSSYKSWADHSLDFAKAELGALCYPFFVYRY